MANYRAIADGNWSTLAIWEDDGTGSFVASSVLPGAGDDVYTNTFIVTITTDATCNLFSRSSNAILGITEGGQFKIDGSNAVTTTGEVIGTDVSQPIENEDAAVIHRTSTHINIWTHIGNFYGGAGSYLARSIAGWNESDYAFELIGDQTAGGYTYSHGFVNNTIAEANITGNQYGNLRSLTYAYFNKSSGTLTIIGNQTGGIAASAYSVYNTSGVINIIGNQTGGIVSSAYAIANIGGPMVTIIGNQTAAAAYAIFNSADSAAIEIAGDCYSSGVAAIYNNKTTTSVVYTGNIYNYLGVIAIFSPRLFLNVTPTTVWEWSDFGGNPQYLVAENSVTGMPAESDVRKDKVYGPVSGLTGTLAVPPPSTVNEGVPTDDTVGIYALSPALLARLGAVATIEELAALLESFSG